MDMHVHGGWVVFPDDISKMCVGVKLNFLYLKSFLVLGHDVVDCVFNGSLNSINLHFLGSFNYLPYERQMRISTASGAIRVLLNDITLSQIEKVDSEATIEALETGTLRDYLWISLGMIIARPGTLRSIVDLNGRLYEIMGQNRWWHQRRTRIPIVSNYGKRYGNKNYHNGGKEGEG
ncbi:hypothetical protein QVD17_08905 [Tagetes erecta]|uniref:Uncharacterized protein n=1 Tax=Tagetes erecta TaxID=13708 RepID=A0AAD8L501_TARER|nr:hypothetical protein QVD17_08905 [Tagetes erecta]